MVRPSSVGGDLGVERTYSRPHVSNDNLSSESQFRTLKYRPTFPARLGSLEDARAFCWEFLPWYHTQHHVAGLSPGSRTVRGPFASWLTWDGRLSCKASWTGSRWGCHRCS